MNRIIAPERLSDKQIKEIAKRKFGSSINRQFAQKNGLAWPLPKGWKRYLVEKMQGQSPVAPIPKATPLHDGKFYASWEWKQARYEALMRHGHRCMCCGWTAKSGQPGHLVVDHIKALKKRPDLALDQGNLQILCNDCNMGKGGARADDFRK